MVSEDLPGTQIGGLGKHVVTLSNALLELGHDVDIMGRSDRYHGGSAAEIGFKGRAAGLRFFPPRLEGIAAGLLQPGQAAVVRAQHRARAAARGRQVRCRALPRPPADGGALRAAGRELRADPPRPGQRMRDPPCASGRNTCARRSTRATAPPASTRRRTCCGASVRAGRAPLPLGDGGSLFAPQDDLRVGLPAPRLPARGAGRRPVARPRDPQLHPLPLSCASAAARPDEVRAGEVLLVGRIDAGKGFGEFLAQVQGWLPAHARVSIVGDGPLRGQLESRYAGPQMRFLGWQPYDEVIRMSARSHVLVIPRCGKSRAAPPCWKRWRWASSAWRWRAAARRSWRPTNITTASCSWPRPCRGWWSGWPTPWDVRQ
jgi:glycosyltransferase involved in cell wall biosynthesis